MNIQTLKDMIEYFGQSPVGDVSRPGRVIEVDVFEEDREEIMFFITLDNLNRFVIFGGALYGTGLYFTTPGPVLGADDEVKDFLEKRTSNVRFTQLLAGHGNGMVVEELEEIEFHTSMDDLRELFDEKIKEISPLSDSFVAE